MNLVRKIQEHSHYFFMLFFYFKKVKNSTIIIIIIIIVHSSELFPSAIADGFSLKSEWQQVSSSLQDSS